MRPPALLALVALAACGADELAGPWDSLPLEGRLVVGFDERADMARDEYGIAHVRAHALADAAFVQGFFMAHDRLPQMDALRRLATGTLSELYGRDAAGNLDGAIIDSDLQMRMHRMRHFAELTWTEIVDSDDEVDSDLEMLLGGFTAGVNRYISELRAGTWSLDPAIATAFRVDFLADWEPVDSLVIARLHAFASSYSVPFELQLTELYGKLRLTYDTDTPATPEIGARRGISTDLLALVPPGRVSTIEGFPNEGTPAQRRALSSPAPDALVDTQALGIDAGPFSIPEVGGSAWAVDPVLGGGSAILTADHQSTLVAPSSLYPTHLTVYETIVDPVTGDVSETVHLDVLGMTVPGVPAVLLGTNGAVAWAGTPSRHDVNDVYREAITSCPPSACVLFNGAPVEIETRPETLRIGHLGQDVEERSVTYETVPHHGPIIPRIGPDHTLLPRDNANTLSVRYTGYAATHELRTLWKLAKARDMRDALVALGDLGHGSQSWTLIDADRHVAWSTYAPVPQREVPVYLWHAKDNPAASAPFFVLPGTGTHEWSEKEGEERVSGRYIPHSIDPPSHFVVSTSADPVGATFDGDPLNHLQETDSRLYVGVHYDAGLRQERIVSRIQSAPQLSADDMANLQHDTFSTAGAKIGPAVVAALAFVEAPASAPPDVRDFVNGLTNDQRYHLLRAHVLLESWDHETPIDSAAPIIFHAWMHFFVEQAIGDELAALPGGFDPWRLDADHHLRIVHALLVDPAALVKSATTAQPILCDRMGQPGDDSCTKLVLVAMFDAMAYLDSPAGFGTVDTSQWSWGAKHQLAVGSLFPDHVLPAEVSTPMPRRGDNSSVNRADHGWEDLDFAQRSGPSHRFIAESCDPVLSAGDGCKSSRIRVQWQLAGGAIFDQRSHHFADLWTSYAEERHFAVPLEKSEIVIHGETRWEFR